jgi:hypothetical protein
MKAEIKTVTVQSIGILLVEVRKRKKRSSRTSKLEHLRLTISCMASLNTSVGMNPVSSLSNNCKVFFNNHLTMNGGQINATARCCPSTTRKGL